MANVVKFNDSNATIPVWETLGDFRVEYKTRYHKTNVVTLGNSTNGNKDWFAVFNANVGIKVRNKFFGSGTPASTVTTGTTYVVVVESISNALTIHVNGVLKVTDTTTGGQWVELDSIGRRTTALGSDYLTTDEELFYIKMTHATDDRDYQVTATGMVDVNQPSGANDVVFNGSFSIVDEAGAGDTTIPVITLSGAASTTITVGGTAPVFTATASDDEDGDITSNIVVTGDVIDVNTVGSYTRRWNVSDAAENAAIEVTRTVVVEAVAGTISIPSSTISGDVYQRKDNNFSTVEKVISYTGSPTSLQYRVINGVTSAEIIGWTTFDASPTGGASDLSIEVPVSKLTHLIEVRFSNSTGTKATETTPWYTGAIILIAGQSLARRLNTEGTATTDPNFFRWSGANNSTYQTDDGTGEKALAQTLIDAENMTVCLINVGVGGSALLGVSGEYWLNESSAIWTDTLAQVDGATQGRNKLEFIWWHQGNQDANSSSSYAEYLSGMGTLFTRFRTEFSNGAGGDLKILSAILGRDVRNLLSGVAQRKLDFQTVRSAQLAYIDSDSLSYPMSVYQIALIDGVHQTATSNTELGNQIANIYINIRDGNEQANLGIVSVLFGADKSEIVITYVADLAAEVESYSLEGLLVTDDNDTELTVTDFVRTSSRTAKITLSALVTTTTAAVTLGYGIGDTSNALSWPKTSQGIISPTLSAATVSSSGVDSTTPILIASPSTTTYNLTIGTDTFTTPTVTWADDGNTGTNVTLVTDLNSSGGTVAATDTYTYDYSDGANDAETMVITVVWSAAVIPENTPPVATITAVSSAIFGATVNLTGGYSDTETDPVSSWTWRIVSGSGTLSATNIQSPTLTGTGAIQIGLVANDGTDNSSEALHTVTFAEQTLMSTAVFIEPDASNLTSVNTAIFKLNPFAFLQVYTATFNGGGSVTVTDIPVAAGTKLIMYGGDANGIDDDDAIALAITATSA